MLRVPDLNATEVIKWEDTEFEVSITLPISFKNQYADKLLKSTGEASFTKYYEIYREIVRKGLKTTSVQDSDGSTLKWDGLVVPDQILDKLSAIQLEDSRFTCLLNWLGQKIWEKNNIGFFRGKPVEVSDTNVKAKPTGSAG